jgi:hypothetical protein
MSITQQKVFNKEGVSSKSAISQKQHSDYTNAPPVKHYPYLSHSLIIFITTLVLNTTFYRNTRS